MRTGRSHPTNSSARDGEGRGPGRRRQVGPGTAGAAEPVGGRGSERSAGACWTSAGARAAAFPWRCPPWPAMRPPVPSLGVLLLLLLPPPPGEATKKPTPCKRCRELVDKFNQVCRSARTWSQGVGLGRPSVDSGITPRWAQGCRTVDLGSPRHGLDLPCCVLLHPPTPRYEPGSPHHGPRVVLPWIGSPHHESGVTPAMEPG